MTSRNALIVEGIIFEYGWAELLRRLAHAFWFQFFGGVTGTDCFRRN